MKKWFLVLLVVSSVLALFFSAAVQAQQTVFKWKIQSGAPAVRFPFRERQRSRGSARGDVRRPVEG